MGFFTICAGVVLLQLSKSAKDVPDTAVFAGDLDQVRTIAEQAATETEPKADAIRGAGLGTIVRRFSVARNNMELEEAKRLHDEKQAEMASINEGEEQYVWDGIRRRKTSREVRGQPSVRSMRATSSSRAVSSHGGPPELPHPNFGTPRHPPLGMSHFPSYDDIPEDEEARPGTGGIGSSFLGSVGSFRSRMASTATRDFADTGARGQPVPLSNISIARHDGSDEQREHVYGLPPSLAHQDTSYGGADMSARPHTSHGRDKSLHITYEENPYRPSSAVSSQPPSPPQHKSNNHRQFSFHNVFHKTPRPSLHDAPLPGLPRSRPISNDPRHHRKTASRSGVAVAKGATEEERLGLVKGDTNTMTPDISADSDSSDSWGADSKHPRVLSEIDDEKGAIRNADLVPVMSRGRARAYSVEDEGDERDIGLSRANVLLEAARRGVGVEAAGQDEEEDEYAARRRRWENRMSKSPEKRGGGGGGGNSGGAAFL